MTTTALDLLRAVLYGRQSKGKAASIADQLHLGDLRSVEEGWSVTAIFQDRVSASRHSTSIRSDWPRLVAMVEARELDVIWLWETSRGDRKAGEWIAFVDRCAELGVQFYVEKDRRLYDPRAPKDWETMALDGVKNQVESDQIRERTNRGKDDARRLGRLRSVLGGPPPVGFRDGRADWETDEAHAAVMRATVDQMRRGLNLRAAFRAATAEHGMISTNGADPRPVTEKMMRQALKRPASAGIIMNPDRTEFGFSRIADPPLDEARYRWLQEWFGERKSGGRPGGGGDYPYVLGPVLRCSRCGNQLTGAKIYYRGTDRPTYACKNPHKALGVDHPCRGVSVPAPALDALVAELVDRHLSQQPATDAGDAELAARREELEAAVADNKRWLLALYDNAREGVIEAWEVDERAPLYRHRLAELREEIASVEQEEAGSVPATERWADLDDEQRRALVLRLWDGPILVLPGKSGPRPLPIEDRIATVSK